MAEDKEKNTEEVDDSVDQRAIEHVLACKEESLKFYAEKFKRFNYFDRLYIKGAAKTNTPYGRANLELPLAFQQVEPFVSQMTETMLGEAPYLAYEARTLEEEEKAKTLTDYTQYQLDVGGFLPASIQFLRSLGKYGSSVVKVPWEVEILEVEDDVKVLAPIIDPKTKEIVIDPVTGEPQLEYKIEKRSREIKSHDGPRFYSLSLFDFFVPKSASSCDVQKMDWNIHRMWRNPEALLSNPNYKNKAKIKKLLCLDEEEEDLPTSGSKLSASDSPKQTSLLQNNSKGEEKFEGEVEILEYWGSFRFNSKKPFSVPALLVVAIAGDEKILLRAEPNPLKFKFKPFIMSNDYPIEGEPYGYGELDHIKGLIEESTALRNARLDVANLSLNRTWLVERSSGINLREVKTAPNNIILTNDLNGIKAVDMGQVTPSSVNELARIDYDIQNTTEIINPRQDVSSVGAAFGGTATGVNFLSAKSNLRMLTKARLLEETYFKPLANMLNWYNKDLLGDADGEGESLYFKTGNQENPYGSISPEVFLTEVDFKPTSNPQKLNLEQRKGNMSYLLQTVAQVEKVAPGTNDLPELLKEVYKLSGFSHPEKFVKPQQTTILQLPNGQVVDKKGQPINIVPVDEQGQPLQQGPSPPPPQ